MALLMGIAGLIAALHGIAALRHREFPYPGVPIIQPTKVRHGRAAIEAGAVCVFIAVLLWVLPALFFLGAIASVSDG